MDSRPRQDKFCHVYIDFFNLYTLYRMLWAHERQGCSFKVVEAFSVWFERAANLELYDKRLSRGSKSYLYVQANVLPCNYKLTRLYQGFELFFRYLFSIRAHLSMHIRRSCPTLSGSAQVSRGVTKNKHLPISSIYKRRPTRCSGGITCPRIH